MSKRKTSEYDHEASPTKKPQLSELKLGLKKQNTPLAGPEFIEAVDPGWLNRLIESKLLKTEIVERQKGDNCLQFYRCSEEDHLKKLKAQVARRDGRSFVVKYKKPKAKFGRVYPTKYISLGSLRKAVRHTLCEGLYVDIDVKNCHPEILRQVFRANGINTPALDRYVDHRDELLKTVADALFVEGGDPEIRREQIKILYIRCLYGGSPAKWIEEAKTVDWEHDTGLKLVDNPQMHSSVTALRGEIKTMARHVKAHNKDLVKEVKKKTGKTYNFDGTLLSYYAQEWERRVLETVFDMLVGGNYIEVNQCVLCFDGIMLLKSRVPDMADVLQKCERVVLDKLHLKLAFTEKKMTTGYRDRITAQQKKKAELDKASELHQRAQAEALKHKIATFTFPDNKCRILDTSYLNDLGKQEGGYEIQKRYLEIFCAKVMKPDCAIMWTSRVKEKDEHGGFHDAYKSEAYGFGVFRQQLQHVRQWKDDDDGPFEENGDFTSRWLRDPNLRVYNSIDFKPHNGVFDPAQEKTDENKFNLFRGYNLNTRAPIPPNTNRDEVLKGYFKVGLELCGGNKKFFDFFMKCIGAKIQFPHKKIPIAFVFWGPQGTGKDTWLAGIQNVIGFDHFYSTTNPDDLFGTHAIGFKHKIIVVMNECQQSEKSFLNEGKIKGAISDVYMTVNAKHAQPIRMENIALIIFTSNKSNSIKIDVSSGDRRFVVQKTSNWGTKQPAAFWSKARKHWNSPTFIRCLYDYCTNMDVSGFDWKQERKDNLTPAYYAMAKLSVPVEALFFSQFVQDIHRQHDFNPDVRDGCRWKLPEEYSEPPGETHDHIFEPWPANGTISWAKKVSFKKNYIYNEYVAWAKQWNHKYVPTAAGFYNKIEEVLDLPIEHTTQRNGKSRDLKSNGYPVYRFVPNEIFAFMTAKNWIDPEEDVDEPDADAAALIAKEQKLEDAKLVNEWFPE